VIRVRLTIGVSLVLLVASAVSAPAQSAQDRPVHRIEATFGGLWLGGADLGTDTATLRANATGTPSPFTLFTTESRFGSTPGLDARVGYGLTRTMTVELGLVFSRPEIRTGISNDVENAPALTVAEPVEQSSTAALSCSSIGSRSETARSRSWPGAPDIYASCTKASPSLRAGRSITWAVDSSTGSHSATGASCAAPASGSMDACISS
jgi:hypothetical protein